MLALGLVQVYQPHLDRSSLLAPAVSRCLLRDCDPALQQALQASHTRIGLPKGNFLPVLRDLVALGAVGIKGHSILSPLPCRVGSTPEPGGAQG